jgi:thiol-disulfide isomerase/thioredoxin
MFLHQPIFQRLALIVCCVINFFSCSAQALVVQDEKLGKISKAELFSIKPEWLKQFNNYEQIINKNSSDKLLVKIVFAYKCHDSEREVPLLLYTLNKMGFSDEQVELLAIDKKKINPKNIIKDEKVFFTPTIIFYNGQIEVKRFVESSDSTWEADINKIIKML